MEDIEFNKIDLAYYKVELLKLQKKLVSELQACVDWEDIEWMLIIDENTWKRQCVSSIESPFSNIKWM